MVIRSRIKSPFGFSVSKSFRRIRTNVNRLIRSKKPFPSDFTPEQIEIVRRVKPYTKTSRERIQAMVRSVDYLLENDIPGVIAECGVYRGGSMMAAALALMERGCQDRDLYLFDTFEGMPDPTDIDVNCKGLVAVEERKNRDKWSYCPLGTVQEVMASTRYNPARIHYVKGMVEDTIPKRAPQQIAMLRLDTDWYESTKHELVHLFPRLATGGLLLIDDYGHWEGARQATEEYIRENNLRLFLHRIDYTGRIAVKT